MKPHAMVSAKIGNFMQRINGACIGGAGRRDNHHRTSRSGQIGLYGFAEGWHRHPPIRVARENANVALGKSQRVRALSVARRALAR